MKKFKVKNRQKRRYTKRQKSSAPASVSRTAFIGLIPFIGLAVAFMALTILNTSRPFETSFTLPNITFTIPTISLPTIVFPTLTNPFESLPSFTIPAITLPELSFSMKPITLPSFEISFTPVLQFFTTVQAMLLNTLLALNPLPFLSGLVKGLYAIELYLFHMSITSVNTIITYSITLEIYLLHLLVAHGEKVINNVISVSTMTIQGVTIIALFLHAIIVQIIKTIHEWFIALIKTIQAPFITLGEYGTQLKPYIDYLGIHIKQALSNMSSGMTAINTVSSEFLKPK